MLSQGFPASKANVTTKPHMPKKKHPGAPKRNQNARKAPGETLDAALHILCKSGEKKRWNDHAKADGKTLAKWARERLGVCE